MYEFLDRRYALALYKVAEEKGKVDQFLAELKNIVELVDKDADFQMLIHHPSVSTENKKKLFENLFKGKVEEDVLSFLKVLLEKGRILEIGTMLKQMEIIYLEKHNTAIAEVKTVVPLLEEEKTQLVSNLQKKFNKTIILKEELDAGILGGIFVKIDNEVIDGTVKSKIEEMKKIMLKRE
ncbi:MAG: synthase subunit delta [Firmicutes bacterium]|nr:synthase subunit delta [Bacillota bacterium]